MPFVLKREYTMKHAQTGADVPSVSYHVGADIFVVGSSRIDDAKRFLTAAEARCYSRKYGLDLRGYKPMRLVVTEAAK